jgi:hypothetical protein
MRKPHDLSPSERHRREGLFLRLYLVTVVVAVALLIYGFARGRAALAIGVFAIIVVPNGIIGLLARREGRHRRNMYET